MSDWLMLLTILFLITPVNKNIASIICIPLLFTLVMQPALSQNIVTNGDFENYLDLPDANGEIELATSWEDVILDADFIYDDFVGYAPQIGGVYSGMGYAGLATYSLPSGSAEAIGQDISASPITTSSAYHIEFYAKKSVGGSLSQTCGGVELYGFVSPPPTQMLDMHIGSLPGAIKLWTSELIDDPLWRNYSGCFTSNISINYIVLTLRKTPSCGQYVYLDSIVIETMSFDSLINTSLGNDTVLCKGDSLVLDASFSNATYEWSDNSTNPVFTIKQQGAYWVKVSNGCGTDCDTITVNYDSLSTVDLGNDTVICPGMSMNLNATTLNASYLWDNGSTDSIIKIYQEGTYWVAVKNRCGTVSDTLTVTPASISTVYIGNDTVLCKGELLAMEIEPQANVSYLWQDGTASLHYVINDEGTYWLAAINACGIAVDTINVGVDSLPNVNFGEDLILCDGEQIVLNSVCQNATYTWHDHSGTPTYTVTREGAYWVEVMNHCGISTDTVVADYVNCYHTLFIPNSFSPNNDGLNDQFGPKCDCSFTEYHFSIFNRWGERIFETRDPFEAWNGCTEKGSDFQMGVYVYLLNYKISGESIARSESGDVTLLK
jgi:gliding motility-associated-like protein